MTKRQGKSAEELAWWMALHGAERVGAATFQRLLQRFGSPKKVLTTASAENLHGLPGADAALLDSLVFASMRVDYACKLHEKLVRRGIQVITCEEADYPEPLLKLRWPPGIIYVQGEYRPDDLRSVGIIGSTHPSARGFRSAYRAASAIAKQGYTVVSGNAAGIDTAAHLGALDAGGRSIFVLPVGITHFHTHTPMPRGKLDRHAVILSERPPESLWETSGALERNRITAALSSRLLIVESEVDGGTIHTFRIAHKLGLPCAAALYKTDTPEGNLQAIREGAAPVESMLEVLRVAGQPGEAPEEQKTFDWE